MDDDDKTPIKEFDILKEKLEKQSLSDVTEQIMKDLSLLKNTVLDIAITGMSGVGKSSFINALRGMTDYEEGAATIGTTQATMEPKAYPHPTFPKVTLWDLPGIGTPQFESKKYLKKVNFPKYDFFIIVASDRFTTHDVLLAREIQKMEKKFYYVRTKMDQSIEAEKRDPNFKEEKTVEKIRKYCCDSLIEAGEFNPTVFLIFSWNLNKYDFPSLQETLENELDELKKYALIAIMPAFSREVLKKKKAAMESLIFKVALASGVVGAVPIPGLSIACDLGILAVTMIYFCNVFGLNEDSLCRLANHVGKPIDVLKSAITKSSMASNITIKFVSDLLTKSLVHGPRKALKFSVDRIPVLGSLAGGGLSFVTTFYMLKSFLNDVEEDAENVQAKAAES
ncbi:interferon-inducible GTPase 5-like [Eublepharis macularius]|uniref:Interferon-inducible GTPase 5-like n=1 Tax=Eublepharis macularius TaxID=481883 RepID=A0AA97LGB5_EUBMA|nr:interferon-inducible GTPase 5-like [Eublepharis macularius]